MLATAYFAADTLDGLRRDSLGDPTAYVQLMIGAACILLVWMPRWGMWLAAVTLVACMTMDPHGLDLDLLILAPMLTMPILRGRKLALWLVYVVTCAPLIAVFQPNRGASLYWECTVRLLSVFIGSLVGLAVRGVQEQHRSGERRIQELELENEKIRADERSALARELHDVVAHQLSIISLQIMGHRDADDPEELREALDRVDDAARAALGELQLLVMVLRDDDPNADQMERLAEVAQPTAVLRQVVEALTDNGFPVHVETSEGLDHLDHSTKLTLVRVVQEATTNILRHAPEESPVEITVVCDPATVAVRIVSALAGKGNMGLLRDHSMGYGLRGLRERVTLTGGTIVLGPDAGHWVVAAELPRRGGAARRTGDELLAG